MDRMNWAYWNPVKIRFGSGLLDEVAGQIGGRRWALVTYDQPIFRELSARREHLVDPIPEVDPTRLTLHDEIKAIVDFMVSKAE